VGHRALTLRAAVGGLLVTVALLGVSQAYAHADRPPSAAFVVATRTLAPGTALVPDALELLPVDLPPTTARRAFTSVEAVDGAVLLAPLEAGEPILLSQVLPPGAAPTSGVDLSFAVPTERALAGDVAPGERLDLVASFPTGATRVVAHDALLTSASSSGDALLESGEGLVLTVRLQSRDELLGVVDAVDDGQVTVVRPSPEVPE
jgi:Flp pilus assembly protein CpaB